MKLKRSSVEYETDSKSFKVKRTNNTSPRDSDTKIDTCYKQKFKFIDEVTKLWNLEIHVQSISFSIGSNNLISIPDWITNRNENVVETSLSSVYTDIIENIDLLLLVSITTSDQTTIHNFIDGNDFININKEKRHLLKENFLIENAIVI